jgi:hypothetical protein
MADHTISARRFNLQGGHPVVSKEINGLHFVSGVIERPARCGTKRSA